MSDPSSLRGFPCYSSEKQYSSQIMLNLEIQYMMRCPRCTAFLKPPIYSCTKGHNYCNICFENNSTNCYHCSSKKAPFRCTLMERIYSELRFPCKYYSKGCSRVLRGVLLPLHEYECSYKN
ncbi:E3 ubiquitin-protein ligase DIS1-like [Coccinella septempunctata]|uniref:E3 ubiquitin-protein ligase DIS1-like n=1 Tax=Coccinella septempunctata TaxID=41139 RepID=UPI001D06C709|nr:E3 ubiquitin-protein ligase DIS1-like [Coccinella septempunctata]